MLPIFFASFFPQDIVQSWAFQKEGCEPAGPACFQKNGGVFCIPMHVSESCATSTRRSKKTSSSVQSFLYVWSMADVDSKNIRHVSTKVELSSSVRHVLPLVCNAKKIAGDRQSLKKYSSGFLVITNDGEAYILDTETSTLHGVDLPTGSTKILSASCNENGFDLAYTVQHGKTNDTNIFIATFTLAEYPSVRLMRIWRLDTDEAQDGALMSIECRNRRAIALFSNGLTLIYHTEEMVTTVSEDSKLLMPVCVRHLRLDSVGAQPKGRKRGHTGFPTLDGDLKVSIDNFSRAFIFRHDHKSLIKIITVDLLYGSILWSGCIERETSAELISQVCVGQRFICHEFGLNPLRMVLKICLRDSFVSQYCGGHIESLPCNNMTGLWIIVYVFYMMISQSQSVKWTRASHNFLSGDLHLHVHFRFI